MKKLTIEVNELFASQGTAKLDSLPQYESAVIAAAGEGNEVLLTGAGPVWLYLRLAHALHGKCRKLSYSSPVTGEVVIFDHSC